MSLKNSIRIYWNSLKSWAANLNSGVKKSTGIVVGVAGFALLFSFLIASHAITVTGYSQNQTCAGTIQNPCIAYINFTANKDIFLYPTNYDPYGRNGSIFYTDQNISGWKLYRSWGSGWREINLTGTCTSTWCGAPSNNDLSNKYSIAFRKGRNYTLKIVAYKNDPSENIEWGFGDVKSGGVDPSWLGINYKNIMPNLVSNKADITGGSAVFDLINPSNKNMSISSLYFNFTELKNKISSYEIYINSSENYSVPTYGVHQVIKNISKIDNLTGKNVTSQKVFNEIYQNGTIKKTRFIWKPFNSIPPGEHQIKIVGHWKANQATAIDWLPNLEINKSVLGTKNNILINRNDWAWWNTSFGYYKQITVSENAISNISNYTILKNIPYSSNMNADFSDLRFISSDNTIELSYFIQNYTSSTSANVWIKIPKLNNTANYTFYMYYGNSAATSQSNASATFLWYDNASSNRVADYSMWNQGSSSTMSWNSGGYYTMSIGSSGFEHVSYVTGLTGVNDDYEVQAIIYATVANCGGGIAGSFINTGNGIGTRLPGCGGTPDLVYYSGGTPSNLVTGTGTYQGTYLQTLRRMGNNIYFLVNGTSLLNYTGSISSSGTSGGIVVRQAATDPTPIPEYKDIRIRKWVNPEPTSTIGAEQSLATSPTITFNSQNPSDISTYNLYGNGLTINYTVKYYQGVEPNVTIYYKTNDSLDNNQFYINGTGYSGFFSKVGTNNSDNWSFSFNSHQVYPGIFNLNQTQIQNTAHSYYPVTTFRAIKMQFLNFSNTDPYNIFMFMANSTSDASPINAYYCNSSYISGDMTLNPNCIQFGTMSAQSGFNISETGMNNSKYQLLSLFINTTTHKVENQIPATSTSYIILTKPNVGGTWYFYYVPTNSRNGAMATSINKGNAWVNQTYTFDAHLHQYDGNAFHYHVCATGISANTSCSTNRTDLIQLAGMSPSSPIISSPMNQTYFGNLNINYSAAISPNSYPIVEYNISLLNPNMSFNKTIIGNNSNNLSYVWNTSTISDGGYYIKVVATDNQSQTSFGISPRFTIANNAPTVQITYPLLNNYTSQFNTLNYTVSSNGISCWYSTDGGLTNSSTLTSGTNFTGLSSHDGTNIWTVYCNNTVNIIGSDSTTFYIYNLTFTADNQTNNLLAELGTPINLTAFTNFYNVSFDINHPAYGNNQSNSYLTATLNLVINYFRNILFGNGNTSQNLTYNSLANETVTYPWCYQESANVSNQSGIDGNCGLYYSGSYSFTGNWTNQSNLYDGNFSTYGSSPEYNDTWDTSYPNPEANTNQEVGPRFNVTSPYNLTLYQVKKVAASTTTRLQLYQINASNTSQLIPLDTATYSGNTATFGNDTLISGKEYALLADNGGLSYTTYFGGITPSPTETNLHFLGNVVSISDSNTISTVQSSATEVVNILTYVTDNITTTYIKPQSAAINSKILINASGTLTNVTIPNSCFNYSSSLQFRISTNYNSSYYCYNGGWVSIYNISSSNASDTAIWWNVANRSSFSTQNISIPVHQYDSVDNVSFNISGNTNAGNSTVLNPQIIVYQADNSSLIDRIFYGSLVGNLIDLQRFYDGSSSKNLTYTTLSNKTTYIYVDDALKIFPTYKLFLNLTGYLYGFSYTGGNSISPNFGWSNYSDINTVQTNATLDSSGAIQPKRGTKVYNIYDNFTESTIDNTTRWVYGNETLSGVVSGLSYTDIRKLDSGDLYLYSSQSAGSSAGSSSIYSHEYSTTAINLFNSNQINVSYYYKVTASSANGYSTTQTAQIYIGGTEVVHPRWGGGWDSASYTHGCANTGDYMEGKLVVTKVNQTTWEKQIYGTEYYSVYSSSASSCELQSQTYTGTPSYFTVNNAYAYPLYFYTLVQGNSQNSDNLAANLRIRNVTRDLYNRENSTVVSNVVYNTGGKITSATMSGVQYSTPINETVYYYMSADNGVHWENVVGGAKHVFTYPGQHLKWKVNFVLTGKQNLNYTYNLIKVNVSIPETNPSNVSIGIGDTANDYVLAGGNFTNNTQVNLSSINLSKFFNSSYKVEGYNHLYKIPITVHSQTAGIIGLSNLNLTYNPNPIYLNLTSFDNKLNTITGSSTIPILINAINGTINVSDLRYDFAGGNHTYSIIAHTLNDIIQKTINITYYFSQWDYHWVPSGVNFLYFQPNTPTSQNVTPYGQQSNVPIMNLTDLGYGGKNATLSVKVNSTLSCVNTTLSLDNNKSNGILLNSTFQNLTDMSYLQTKDIYMWSDYNCSYSNWYNYNPSIYFRLCVDGGVCSTQIA